MKSMRFPVETPRTDFLDNVPGYTIIQVVGIFTFQETADQEKPQKDGYLKMADLLIRLIFDLNL